jgi:hypothetical protein
MSGEITLTDIIKTGSLKTYFVGKSFTEVYWVHPQIPNGKLCLFKFTTHNQEFFDVSFIVPKYLPKPYKPKQYRAQIKKLVESLV